MNQKSKGLPKKDDTCVLISNLLGDHVDIYIYIYIDRMHTYSTSQRVVDRSLFHSYPFNCQTSPCFEFRYLKLFFPF